MIVKQPEEETTPWEPSRYITMTFPQTQLQNRQFHLSQLILFSCPNHLYFGKSYLSLFFNQFTHRHKELDLLSGITNISEVYVEPFQSSTIEF